MIFYAWSSEKWVSSCVNVVTLISRYLMLIIYGIDPDNLVRCVKKQATKTHYFNIIRHVSLVLLFLIAEVTIQLVSPPCPNILGNTMINPTECNHHQSIHSETWSVWNGGRLVMSWFQNGSIHWKYKFAVVVFWLWNILASHFKPIIPPHHFFELVIVSSLTCHFWISVLQ